MVSDRSKVDVSNVEPTVCLVVALKSEAKPIISYFELDHQSGNNIFPIYRNDKLGHALIISGVGQINAAAATTYLASESDAPLGCVDKLRNSRVNGWRDWKTLSGNKGY